MQSEISTPERRQARDGERKGGRRRGRGRRRARGRDRDRDRDRATVQGRTDDRDGDRVRVRSPGRSSPADLGKELRVWLSLAERLLSSVERLAWDARAVVDEASQVVEGLRGSGGQAGRVARARRTGWMLTQVAAGYRLYGLRAAFVTEAAGERMLDRLHARSARSFSDVSAEQGGAFLKVGQLLSARADLLPAVWIEQLSRLQDAAPPIDVELVEHAIEQAFGKSAHELFAEFEREPIAAASIGQVHRATTDDGQVVAVKVQRPGVAALVDADMDMLELFIDAMRSMLPDVDHDTIVAEVRSAVRAELDYIEEAHVTGRVARAFRDVPGVIVPEPVPHLCAQGVLTTRFVEGRKITDVLDELKALSDAGDAAAHAQISELLGRLFSIYLQQVLEHGLFQADPHPGNLMVTAAGELVLLDFGCSKELLPGTRALYLDLLAAFLGGDRDRMPALFDALGFETRTGKPDTLMAFTDALLGEIAQAATGELRWPEREELIARARELAGCVEADPVTTIPPEFVMLGRVFGTLGGIFSHYRPQIDFARHVMPVIGDALSSNALMKSARIQDTRSETREDTHAALV